MTTAAKSNSTSTTTESETASRASNTRLGHIEFINALPIVLPLVRGYVQLDAESTFASPAKLNHLIAQNQLDISAMSSFSYISQPELSHIPNLSISCKGPVGSVLLFSKYSLDELASPAKRIIVTDKSATSVNLLKVLLLEQHGHLPQITSQSLPDITCDTVDAVLVIGDHALEVDTTWSQRYLRIDMGDWWWRHSNRPMVFGIWATQQQWKEANPDAYNNAVNALLRSKELGLGNTFNEVLDLAEQRTGLSRSRLQHYFKTQLDFDLNVEHLEGLAMYKALTIKHGLLPPG